MYYVDPVIKDFYRYGQPEGRAPFLRLDQNENPDGLPRWVYDKVLERMSPEYLSMYPEETAFVEKYAKALGLCAENVTLTDGSVVAMGYVIRVFGEPGKNLLCVTPTFGMYKVYAEMTGMNVKMIHYEEDFRFDVEKLIDAIDENVGLVSVVNPNMPVGNTYKKEDIVRIIEKAAKYNAMVIVDEAYHYFFDETCLDLIHQYENVIILRTFSKMFSAAGIRMGAILSNPTVIQYVKNYRPHYTVNSIALVVGHVILDHYDKVVAELKEKFEKGKAFLLESLQRENYRFVPTEGCFICIYPKYRTAEYITEKLKEQNILIFCGKGDSAGLLRVTIWDAKYMKIFMETLLTIDTKE